VKLTIVLYSHGVRKAFTFALFNFFECNNPRRNNNTHTHTLTLGKCR
jgi:hypothetical protein